MEKIIISKSTWVNKAQEFINYLINSGSYSSLTSRAYERDLKDFLGVANEFNKPLDALAFIEVAYVTQKRYWSKLSPASHQRKIACLKSFAKYLQRQKVIKEAVENQLYSPKKLHKIPRYFTVDECLQCAQHIRLNFKKDPSLLTQQRYQVFFVLYLMGLRISEAINLKWSEVNLDAQTAIIDGKGQKQRAVAFPRVLSELILDTRNQSKFVIPRPITPQKAYHLMRTLGEKAGLNKILNPHALRHSYATHLLSDGMSLRVLQGLLGHSNLVATQKYTHLTVDNLSRVIDTQHPLSKKLS